MTKKFKREQAKLVKLVVLITTLADELDEAVNYIELKQHKKHIQDLIKDLEVMIDTVYKQREVQQSTFISELCNKYDYYFKKVSKNTELTRNKLFKVGSILTLIIKDVNEVSPKNELKTAYEKINKLNNTINNILIDTYNMNQFEQNSTINELNIKFGIHL